MIYFFRPVWWVFLGPQRPQRQFPVMNPWEEIHFDLPVLRLQTIPWPSLAHYLPSMNRYVSTKFAPNKNLRVSFLLPIHTVSKVYFLSKNSKSFFCYLLRALKSPQKFRTPSCSSANFLASLHISGLKFLWWFQCLSKALKSLEKSL